MKKLFTLLTLALISIGSAWGQDEILFSWTPKTDLSNAAIDAGTYTLPGGWLESVSVGTAELYVDETDKMRIRGSQLAYNGNNCYVHITTSKVLAKGDKIDISSSGNAGNLWISLTTARPSNASSAKAVITQGTTYIIGEGNDLINEKDLYIWRSSSTVQIGTVTITRPAIDNASPSIDTDLSTTPVDCEIGDGVDFSITASHYTGYQWYRNSSASAAGATEIEGATAANYTFTPAEGDASTTVYIFCVVTNDNATGEKTATSAFAQVNVGALPTVNPVTSKVWNFSSWTAANGVSYIKDDLELKGVDVKSNSLSKDGFSFTKDIDLPKNGSTTNGYVHFKVNAPCAITVYGKNGSSGSRDIQIKIGDDNPEKLLDLDNTDGKKTINFTGSTETDVYLYSTNTKGAIRIHGIVVSDITATISAYEWSTFVSDQPLVFDEVEGLEVYKVTGHDGSAITTEAIDKAVPANTPLLLKGTANQTYYIPMAGSGASAVSGNLLVAGTGTAVSSESGKTKYVLSVADEKAVFKKIGTAGATVPAGKAYLEFSEEISARGLFLDGDATAIKNIKVGSDDNIYYDLQGRRVLYPTKGLYIVNGKTVVVK